jgi:hypothetical protein
VVIISEISVNTTVGTKMSDVITGCSRYLADVVSARGAVAGQALGLMFAMSHDVELGYDGMIEASIIKKIVDSWAADQVHPDKDRVQRPLPNLADVKELLEIVFLASLKREEDKPVRTSMVLVSAVEARHVAQGCQHEINRFEPPIPVTVDAVTKLAPAFDPDLAAIAVEREPDGNGLCCWGVFFFKASTRRFNEFPIVSGACSSVRPDYFTVTIRGPGSLQISRAFSSIGRLVGGDFVPSAATPFTSRSLGEKLVRYFKGTRYWQKYGPAFWDYYQDALEVLLIEAGTRSHGATIILLPPKGNNISVNEFFLTNYYLKPALQVAPQLERAIHCQRGVIVGIAHRKTLLEKIQMLAQLAAVDGALIVTYELDLVTFGATLHAPKWNGTTLIGADGFETPQGAPFPIHRYGTRHNSAVDFVAANEGSIAFVISQDGPTRAFVKAPEGIVHCWPDCTESVYV